MEIQHIKRYLFLFGIDIKLHYVKKIFLQLHIHVDKNLRDILKKLSFFFYEMVLEKHRFRIFVMIKVKTTNYAHLV